MLLNRSRLRHSSGRWNDLALKIKHENVSAAHAKKQYLNYGCKVDLTCESESGIDLIECLSARLIVCFTQELPHKRIIRNLRRLLTEIADKPAEREKHLEQLLLALPRGSADPLAVVRPKPPPTEEPFPEDDEDEKTEKSEQSEATTTEWIRN